MAIFLLSFDSVECYCNCEGPVVNDCCPTGSSGTCCEYPMRRSEKRLDESPLAQKLKKEADDPIADRRWPFWAPGRSDDSPLARKLKKEADGKKVIH